MKQSDSQVFVIAGIDTGVGKTLVSAMLVEALQADYWKPVQAGDLQHSDTDTVRELISNSRSVFHPEAYRLQYPMSPHASAEKEGITLLAENIKIPQTENTLIIELAGGLMVPLNRQTLNLHLLRQWQFPVILVSRYYLGSINHTLLSLEVLKLYQIPLTGLIFNGEENIQSKQVILSYSNVPLLGNILQEKAITKEMVKHYAQALKPMIEQR